MTNKEFREAWRTAAKRLPVLVSSVLGELALTYAEASTAIEKRIAKTNPSTLTEAAAIAKSEEVQAAREAIRDKLIRIFPAALRKNNGYYLATTEAYVWPLFANTARALDLTKQGFVESLGVINNRLVLETLNRTSQKGYNFSARVWEATADLERQVSRLVSVGVMEGLPGQDIAKTLHKYVLGGIEALGPEYKGAKYGIKLAEKVDWRALRLVRSELAMSAQRVAVEAARANPGCVGEVNWVRSAVALHETCVCQANADGSPYPLDRVPPYSHSNCMCILVPVLRPLRSTLDDISRWAEGESVGYLDDWYSGVYVK